MLRELVTTLACLTGPAVLAQDDPPAAPLPYLQASAEDGFIARTLRDERVGHRQFAAAFDDGAAGCSISANPVHQSFASLVRHGVVLDFNDFGVVRPTFSTPTPGKPGWMTLSFGAPSGGGSVNTLIAPGGTGYVGTASAGDCTIQIGWRKFARRDGRWIEAPPVAARDIRDWDELEQRLNRPALFGAAGTMTFLFDTSVEDGCPEGSGFITIRPHSLLSELGGRSAWRTERKDSWRIAREDATRFSNDFMIESGNCRYALSVRLSSRDAAGVLHPAPVSPAVSALRGPAGP